MFLPTRRAAHPPNASCTPSRTRADLIVVRRAVLGWTREGLAYAVHHGLKTSASILEERPRLCTELITAQDVMHHVLQHLGLVTDSVIVVQLLVSLPLGHPQAYFTVFQRHATTEVHGRGRCVQNPSGCKGLADGLEECPAMPVRVASSSQSTPLIPLLLVLFCPCTIVAERNLHNVNCSQFLTDLRRCKKRPAVSRLPSAHLASGLPQEVSAPRASDGCRCIVSIPS